ncbi:MAG: MarR family transcriptional regulator [Granulosicoccus sp.]|nr:MarR family transcriptional regulator [Granulosicoccus sp.]
MKQKVMQIDQSPSKFVADDTTLKQFIGYHLKRTTNIMLADLANTLAPYELRMLTYTALVIIVDNPGIRQYQLADAMDIERPNLVVIVDELEQRELIVRDRVPTDRRAYALQPTLVGKRLYKKATKSVKEQEQILFKEISQGDQKKIVAALGKFLDQL